MLVCPRSPLLPAERKWLAGAVRRCVHLTPIAAATLACSQPPGIERPVEHVAVSVHTAEGDTTRHLLAVGDTGAAVSAAFSSSAGCSPGAVCYAYTEVLLRSSDAAVVSIIPRQSAYLGVDTIRFVGARPGSTYIGAAAEGHADSELVVVVAAPLPLDSVRVRQCCWSPSLYYNQGVTVVTDGAGFLKSATVLRGATLAFQMLAYRGVDSTVYLPLTLALSDSALGSVNGMGNSFSLVRSPPTWATFYGLEPGTATLTVTARGQQYSFLVIVQ